MNYLFIVTGVSQGFGKSIVESIIKYKSENSDEYGGGNFIVLMFGRRKPSDEFLNNPSYKDCNVSLFFQSQDLSSFDNIDTVLENSFRNMQEKHGNFEEVFVINNAGTLGEANYVPNFYNFESNDSENNNNNNNNEDKNKNVTKHIAQTIDLNVTSVIILTSTALSFFKCYTTKIQVIDISSLAATVPKTTWTLYCTGKASRRMFLQVINEDNKYDDSVDIKTLSFGPGIMKTRIQVSVQSGVDSPVKNFLSDVVENNKCVPLNISSDLLLDIIMKREYESGTSLDIYDLKPELLPSSKTQTINK